MRKEPYTVGSYVHVIKRGVRGTPIVLDDMDRWRFVLMLRHFNDEHKSENWFRDLMDEKVANNLNRPNFWPPQRKIVNILCYCLLDNHFHLLLKEIKDGGISTFMHKLGGGMANYYNEKYQEKGSLFQGSYRSKTIGSDYYLRYVSIYIQVKNAFEMYPGGFEKARREFDKAYEWAIKNPFCSLGEYVGSRESPLIDKDLLGEIFSKPSDYKNFARDFVEGRKIKLEEKAQESVYFE